MCSIAAFSDLAATTPPQSRLFPRISAHQMQLFYQKSATLVVLQCYPWPHRLFFFTYKSCCVCWNRRDAFKNRAWFKYILYSVHVNIVATRTHWWTSFFFTNFPAFYFPSIQLKIIPLKKSNFRCKNPSLSQTDLLCSLLSKLLCGCVVF